MALLLKNGDYVADERGGLQSVEGAQDLLQRVLFRLQVRRGSFPFLPELGSRLYLLPREKPGVRQALARQYAAEALREEDVEVTEVTVEGGMDGRLQVRVALEWKGEGLTAEVTL
ncbi:MAG TPA: phage GP46 family protein [Candidatus Intestinimonas stercorigallinarum]|nr:phage GP46 family protein [Candidatus Intestinimonas stercorigallinarum]